MPHGMPCRVGYHSRRSDCVRPQLPAVPRHGPSSLGHIAAPRRTHGRCERTRCGTHGFELAERHRPARRTAKIARLVPSRSCTSGECARVSYRRGQRACAVMQDRACARRQLGSHRGTRRQEDALLGAAAALASGRCGLRPMCCGHIFTLVHSHAHRRIHTCAVIQCACACRSRSSRSASSCT
jgi:hypothetical protein